MTGQYIVQGIFALAGIVSLLASLLNWDWFFTTRNAQTIVRNVGRNRARLFYGILGIIIIGMAIFFFVETRNHTIFRHANFIGCLSADKIKMPVRKYFCFNIPVYRNMAEEPSCRSPYHEEYIQTSVSGNSEGLCRSTYSFLSERR